MQFIVSFIIASIAFYIGYAKYIILISYGYTSDIFIYDQVLQETLRGNFGLEFTYGNQFGDHALVFLLLLLPLKKIFSGNMIYLLISMGPVLYGLVGIILFRDLILKNKIFPSLILLSIYMLSFSCFRSLLEFLYGCHLDMLSGFFAILFSLFLIRMRDVSIDNSSRRKYLLYFWMSYLIFLSLKEEMSLLAIVFFSVSTYIFGKKDGKKIAISVFAFVIQMIFIEYNVTDWNRSNTMLIMNSKIFFFPFLTGHVGYIVVVSYFCIVFISLLALTGIEAYAVCIFLIGLVKLLFGSIVNDFDITSWHNFPGIIMLTGGIIFQFARIYNVTSNKKINIIYAIMTATLAIFLFRFYCKDLHYIFYCKDLHYIEPVKGLSINGNILDERKFYLHEIKRRINKKSVVAINGLTAIDWSDGYRYTSFQRGVSVSPTGISDYIINDKMIPHNRLELDSTDLNKEFFLDHSNKYFDLYKRYSINYKNSMERRKFSALLNDLCLDKNTTFCD
ncbi:MAG: hypothetical protein D3906_06540 [Candidatus Electrothrix sp. AUS1_2]|nr:hypothetical protein [Candidatus Electrothrix sp. AUS1_2]